MLRSGIIALFLALVVLAIPIAGRSAGTAGPETISGAQPAARVPPMSTKAEQISKEIGVLRQVQHLRALEAVCHQANCMSLEELALHQEITETVVVASLDVDRVLAQIDNERAEIIELRQRLSSRLNRKTGFLSMANIITGTGSGIIGTAMQFSNRTAIPGDAVGVAGGVAGVFLSILGLKTHAGTGSLGVGPSMLASLLEPKTSGHSAYPHDVWAYLNTPPAPNSRVHASWRKELINDWVKEKRIGRLSAPSSQKKIELLTSRITNRKRMSLKLLADRSIMLLELRGRVSLMTRNLHDLMKAIEVVPSPQAGWRPERSTANRANFGASRSGLPSR